MLSQNNSSSVIYDVGDIESLQKLILLAKQGDAQAFGEVYTKLYTPLYRYVLSKCKDQNLSEDICQQAFLKFYEALSTYEPHSSPLAYLFTIAKRLLINHGEKKTFTPYDETILEEYEAEETSIVTQAHIKHLSEKINTYVEFLSDDEQEIIQLYYYAELSYKEIASITKKEEPAIRKIKERALKKLRIATQHLDEQQ